MGGLHGSPQQCVSRDQRRTDRSAPTDISISVVIPVGPADDAWRGLLPALALLAVDLEVIFVGVDEAPADFPKLVERWPTTADACWLVAEQGRALQMNTGAEQARGEFLWFLHADSRFDDQLAVAAIAAVRAAPTALHYFDLEFGADGPRWTKWNARGVALRSRVLGLPFGDQGFLMHRNVFDQVGPFDQQAPYGEDHLLVWAAHRRRVPLNRIAAPLSTSARKYSSHGWLRTTARHVFRTVRQAFPQWVRLISQRAAERIK